ncbi:MAG: hypothetical protein K2G13_00045, partial [Muribaculaceae bacterium]|nr:hypothetical protein [Muribaculaceae bacterium]
IFWNKGALDGNGKFDFTVKALDGTVVASFPSLSSTGNMDEQQGKIEGSTSHSLEFDIPSDGDYTVTYSMTSGWSAVIVGNLKIATAMSVAERYKGTFLRTLKQAKELYESIPAENRGSEGAVRLLDVLNKYESLVSTSPTTYENATAELADAIEQARGLSSVNIINAGIVSEEYFNLHGQKTDSSANGVIIVRARYSDGSVTVSKTIK